MATETSINVGLRKNFATFGDRNFEDSSTVQYVSNRSLLNFLGTNYDVGSTLPFNVGGTHYSAAAIEILRHFWNQGWIKPLA